MLLRQISSSAFYFNRVKRATSPFSLHSSATLLAKSYTTEAPSKVKLTLATPLNTICKNKLVDKVKIPGSTGDFVLLASHVPYISEMKPGLLVIEDNKNQEKYFVSGGFVFFHKDSSCSVHAAECVPLEQLDLENAQKVLAKWETQLKTATNEKDKAIARIGIETATEICRVLQAQK